MPIIEEGERVEWCRKLKLFMLGCTLYGSLFDVLFQSRYDDIK